MSASFEPMRQDMGHSPYPLLDPKTPYEGLVDGLPPLLRAVLLMHRRDERNYRVIADRLDIDIPTVEACLAEALATIAAKLEAETRRGSIRMGGARRSCGPNASYVNATAPIARKDYVGGATAYRSNGARVATTRKPS